MNTAVTMMANTNRVLSDIAALLSDGVRTADLAGTWKCHRKTVRPVGSLDSTGSRRRATRRGIAARGGGAGGAGSSGAVPLKVVIGCEKSVARAYRVSSSSEVDSSTSSGHARAY